MAIGTKVLPFNMPQQVATKNPIRSAYDAAATTQASDYDSIMGGYDDLINRSKSGTLMGSAPKSNAIASNYTPNYSYNRSSDLGGLVGGLQEYSRTGGYSDSDVGNIRARAVSPIRAAYGNAQRNLERQKTLQGGYAPGHGAALAKFAREQSSLMSDASTNVNAKIAEMVAAGKLSGMQSLSPLLSQENTLQNTISGRNEDARRETMEGNTQDERNVRDSNMAAEQQNTQGNVGAEMQALSGKSNLYGTTPALTNMFGNQVLQNNQQEMQAVQMANQIKNQRAGLGLNLVQAAQGAIPKAINSGTPRRLG